MSVVDQRHPNRTSARGAPAPTFRGRPALDDSADRRRAVARAVLRAQRGDRDAHRFLYTTYADNVYGYVWSLVRDEHDAEDITQAVFVKLMVAIGGYEQRSMPFWAWMLRVAHNTAIDHLRSSRAVPCKEMSGADPRCDEPSRELRPVLRDALLELSEEQRQVVVLRHMIGLSPGEIAARIGKTENAVHCLHHRGRRRLRESLVRLGSGPVTRAVAG